MRMNMLHRIVNGKSRRYRTSGAVDIKTDIFVGILGLQKKQLCNNQIGGCIGYLTVDKDNTVF